MQLYIFSESPSELNRAHFKTEPPTVAFGDGRKLMDRVQNESIDLRITTTPRLDFFPVGGVPYVSAELKAVFDRAGVEAEYIPVPTQSKRRLFVFNPLIARNCFDRSRTLYKTCPVSGLKSITKLALDPERVPQVPLFCLRRPTINAFCIARRLKNFLDDTSLKGFKVVPLDEWSEH